MKGIWLSEKESVYVEKQLQIDREMSLENAMDELKNENVNLIEINSNLRPEDCGSRFVLVPKTDGDEREHRR